MPRAGRPLMTLVSTVLSSREDRRAARNIAEILASGHRRYAVPIWTALAPSASAATMPRASAMPPGGDNRHAHRVHYLRHQRERADLRGDVAREEHASVPAGLQALGDNGVGAMRLEPARLLHRGRRALDDTAGSLQPLQQAAPPAARSES